MRRDDALHHASIPVRRRRFLAGRPVEYAANDAPNRASLDEGEIGRVLMARGREAPLRPFARIDKDGLFCTFRGGGTVIEVRLPESIHQAHGKILNGTFSGRWHFSFDDYVDPNWIKFGQLRVFNDDTLSPGATWPLHPHRHNEVVTYVAGGEFRHEDDRGRGGVLTQGGVQHTTVGTGLSHAEINNRPDQPMRFVQMWFLPERLDLDPSVEQKQVQRPERTNGFLPLASPQLKGALPLRSDASVFSSFLETGRAVSHAMERGRGAYVYLLEGGPVRVNGRLLPALAAAELSEEPALRVAADFDAELLMVDTRL